MLDYSKFTDDQICQALDDDCSHPESTRFPAFGDFEKTLYKDARMFHVYEKGDLCEFLLYTVKVYPSGRKAQCNCRNDYPSPMCPHIASCLWFDVLGLEEKYNQVLLVSLVLSVIEDVRTSQAAPLLDRPAPVSLDDGPLVIRQMRYLAEHNFKRYDRHDQANRVSARVEGIIQQIDDYLYELEERV